MCGKVSVNHNASYYYFFNFCFPLGQHMEHITAVQRPKAVDIILGSSWSMKTFQDVDEQETVLMHEVLRFSLPSGGCP